MQAAKLSAISILIECGCCTL